MVIISPLHHLLVMKLSLEPINLPLHHPQLALQGLEHLADEATPILTRQEWLLVS